MKKIRTWKTKTKKGFLYHVERITNRKKEDYNRYSSRSGRNEKANRLKEAYPKYTIDREGLKK